MKTYRQCCIALIVCFAAIISAGTAAAIDIASIEDLQKIGNDPAYPLDGSYVLTQDIDASLTATWNSGAGFDPVGGEAWDGKSPFVGVFDGQGHVITRLTIDYWGYSGLFGMLGVGGEVKNLGLEGATVVGYTTGALAAQNDGTVTNCYTTGTVSGGDDTGGLVGRNTGTVENCYTASAVAGSAASYGAVGGLIGDNMGTVVTCYATGAVAGSGYTGGLVGSWSVDSVTGSFWDMETSGQNTSAGGTGLTTAEMLTRSTYVDAGWDFSTVWDMQDGLTLPYHQGSRFAGGTFALSATGSHGNVSISPQRISYSGGEMALLTATPEPGYMFLGWRGPGISENFPVRPNPLPIMVTGDASYEAIFGLPTPISNFDELQKIGNDPAYPLFGAYVLTQDIDASATATWYWGFEPIGGSPGDGKRPFTGTFDGQGHVITGMNINHRFNYAGLFGAVGVDGEVKNLGVEGATISGDSYTGGIVGLNYGTVANCYTTGSVSARLEAGGIVSENYGMVIDCYATGVIAGNDRSGGLVGENFGTIANCYATGTVAGGGGGLVGYNSATVTASFWNTETSGQSTSDWGPYGTGLTTAEMRMRSTYTNAGWDFSTVWDMQDGLTLPYQRGAHFAGGIFSVQGTGTHGAVSINPSDGSYPGGALLSLTATPDPGYAFLGWHGPGIPEDFPVRTNELVIMVTGNASYEAVFELPTPISSIEDLQKIGNDPAYPLYGAYSLFQDIDASATATWNSGAGFNPIGDDYDPFTGVFDGQGHVITGLAVNVTGGTVGLFGVIGYGGEVKNLGLEHVAALVGGDWGETGGLVGTNNGMVTNCYASGTLSGGYYTGGLAGWNNGTMADCYATVEVSGSIRYAGGLVGENYGTMTNCYATGTVSSSGYYIGGLAGENSGTVTDCYATGTVSGSGDFCPTGGLVGSNGGTITNSYATGAVWGSQDAGGLVGDNYGTVMNCYATGLVVGGSNVGGLIGRNGGTVANCYATGSIIGGRYTGGIVGQNEYRASTTASFWNMDTSGQTTSAGGTGLTTAEMLSRSTYVDAGWDFSTVWDIQDGFAVPYHQGAHFAGGIFSVSAAGIHGNVSISPSGSSYPGGALVLLTATPDPGYIFLGWRGAGISEDFPSRPNPLPIMVTGDAIYEAVFVPPTPISSIDDLQMIGNDPAYPLYGAYMLTQDIDASSTASWNSGAGFEPIGGSTSDGRKPFTGTFDGQGHVITGLIIGVTERDSVGLFGAIGPGGKVKNLGLEGGVVAGGGSTGGLVGSNSGMVANCYATAAVSGGSGGGPGGGPTGGLVGSNSGTVTDCYANSAVSGGTDYDNAGGLVGSNSGTVTSCYAAGSVSGSQCAGGLIGSNYDTVTNCYATGAVAGGFHTGGLVGENDAGTITNCYATGLVVSCADYAATGGLVGTNPVLGLVTSSFWIIDSSGQATSRGGVGLTMAEMVSRSTYTDAGWDFSTVWEDRKSVV